MAVKRIGGIAALGVAVLVGVGLSARPAHATFLETLTEVGGNVVVTGSGTLGLSGLTFVETTTETFAGQIQPTLGLILTGPATPGFLDFYSGVTGPASIGSGGFTGADSGTGDLVGLSGGTNLFVPAGYVSGSALSDSMTFDNTTLRGLGVTPGTYVWTWGPGTDDSFTVNAGVSPVPEPSSVALLGPGLLGLVAVCRRRQKRTAI